MNTTPQTPISKATDASDEVEGHLRARNPIVDDPAGKPEAETPAQKPETTDPEVEGHLRARNPIIHEPAKKES